MQLFKFKKSFNYIKWHKATAIFSVTMLLVSLITIGLQSFNYGIDFTGGSLIHVVYPESADVEGIRTRLENAGFSNVMAKNYGSSLDVEIRLLPEEGADLSEVADQVMEVLTAEDPGVRMLRQDYVGPQIGDELTSQGLLAVLYAMIGILIYVSIRFQLKFAIGALLPLMQDVIVVLGIFSLFQLEFDLSVVAAILAIIGYSLNDSIVVFDRIRENFRILRKATPEEVVNKSLNETLARTLMTSLSTLIVLIPLLLIGGSFIKNFAIAMSVGVVHGTYSSMFTATKIILALGVNRQDLTVTQREISGDGSQV